MFFQFLFFVLFIGISLNAFSQDDSEMSCFKVNDFSVEERNQNYPYNKASRIIFVSFKSDYKKLTEEEQTGVIEKEEFDDDITIYVMDGAVMKKYFDILAKDFSRYNPKDFEESVNLKELQKKELTDLIFNYGNNSEDAIVWYAACYMPRNAILYFNEDGELFEFIEICFECNRYRTSNDNINLDYNCGEKLNLLQNLFAKVGIKYGVEE